MMSSEERSQLNKESEQGTVNPPGIPPPAYAAAAYNTGYVPDNIPRYPPAYAEKEPGDPSFPVLPPYTGTENPPPGSYPIQPPPPTGYYQIAGQQPIGYGMSTGNPQAYIYVQPTPLADPPNDYMGYSLFVTICCCWIVGLFAVARSSECRTAIRMGNRQEAVMRSQQARKYAHIALGLGIVSIAVAIVIFGVYYGLMMQRIY